MSTSGIGQSTNGNGLSDGLYEFLENELNFQRKRKQEIFSWASSLLTALIGGVIALTAYPRAILALVHKCILTGAISILMLSSCIWIRFHWKEYRQVWEKLSPYYKQIPLSDPSDFDWPSVLAIIGLSLAALLAVWLPITSCTAP